MASKPFEYSVNVGGQIVDLESPMELTKDQQRQRALQALGMVGPSTPQAARQDVETDERGRVLTAPLQAEARERLGADVGSVVGRKFRSSILPGFMSPSGTAELLGLDTPEGVLLGLGGVGVGAKLGSKAASKTASWLEANPQFWNALAGATSIPGKVGYAGLRATKGVLPYLTDLATQVGFNTALGGVVNDQPLEGAARGLAAGVLTPPARVVGRGMAGAGRALRDTGREAGETATQALRDELGSMVRQGGSGGTSLVPSAQELARRKLLPETAAMTEASAVRAAQRKADEAFRGKVSEIFLGAPVNDFNDLQRVLVRQEGYDIAHKNYRDGLGLIAQLVPSVPQQVPSRILNPATGQPLMTTQQVPMAQMFEELSNLGRQRAMARGDKKIEIGDAYRELRDRVRSSIPDDIKPIFDKIQGEYRRMMAVRDLVEDVPGIINGNQLDVEVARKALLTPATAQRLQQRIGSESMDELQAMVGAGTGEGPRIGISVPLVPKVAGASKAPYTADPGSLGSIASP